MAEFKHISVLADECMKYINPTDKGVYVDGTLGGGGHTGLILEGSNPCGIVIGIDKDEDALKFSRKHLEVFGERLIQIKGNFMDMKSIIPEKFIGRVDAILLDLGVSSYQLDNGERGFSFMHDGLLDMRMDKSSDFSASDVINGYSKQELMDIFYKYGEEKWSARIAEFIVEARKEKPITTTFELVDVIKKAVPASFRNQQNIHFATRVFQAVRIEVNGELDRLASSLWDMMDVLGDGGRLCVITFHSLEDRIVKQVFRKMEKPCECPPKAPMCFCGKKPTGKVVTRKPVVASDDEIKENPRSRSAKLRIFEKKSNL